MSKYENGNGHLSGTLKTGGATINTVGIRS